MGKALYRKYRSKKLSEIVGQEHVTTALGNALQGGRIGHAYLFTGPRGTGKTSVARILAHEVNNLPYDESSSHLDIIEIDAASNRRIDEIRSLREKVHNAPTSAKYKVYIIDEVHMLTREAFNALLKTLEEPPEHVIFVLATTEVHKLPDTIISRTQRYNFKPAEMDAAAKHLKSIAQKENIDISDEALELVASHGRGSFRDSISLLDQVSNTNTAISADDVRHSLGIAPSTAIHEIIQLIATGTPGALIAQLRQLHEQGYQAPQVAKQISHDLRSDMIEGTLRLPNEVAAELLKQLIDIPASHEPQTLLEITLMRPNLARLADIKEPVKPKQRQDTVPEEVPVEKKPKPQPVEEPAPQPEEEAQTEMQEPKKLPHAAALDETSWQQVLHALKQQHNTLYGIARMAVPVFDDGTLTLSFSFPFHQKRMEEARNKQKLRDIITSELGGEVEIVCIVDRTLSPAPNTPTKGEETATDNTVDTISNIFGGAEVLE